MDEAKRSALFVLAALLITTTFAGCAQPEGAGPTNGDDDEPGGDEGPYVEGIGPAFVVLMNPIHASGCRSAELVVEVPLDHAEGLLPEGFEPAPGPVTGRNAGLVIEITSCASAVSEADDSPYTRAWLGVLVKPPTLPEPAARYEHDNRTGPQEADTAMDLYVLAAYTNGPAFARFLRQSGIPHEEARFELGLETLDDARLVQARVESREQGEAMQLAGLATAAGQQTQHRTAWATTQHGVQAFEELHAAPGGQSVPWQEGSAACVVQDGSLFAAPLGPYDCHANLLRVHDGFNVTGHSLWFHDTRVL